ncbi:MAG: peptidoglycan-binding protein, partial [bacterium]|nr:peptidoglycan-binding protein [bacterium]
EGAGAALPEVEAEDVTPRASADLAARMFPHTPRQNIEANLPHILGALRAAGHVDRAMVLTALATIRAETEGFLPIGEGESRYNTSPGGHPFDLYDRRRDLGNEGPPDGERYRGRGYVQLTGKDNYRRYGAALGADLLAHPEEANAPGLAARILAAFLADKERRIKEGVLAGDLAAVRRLVNGGSHGLDRFREAFETGARLLDGE